MNQSIADIKNELNVIITGDVLQLETSVELFAKKYCNDTRKGVINLLTKGEKIVKIYNDELERVKFMLTYEECFKDSGYIGGIDEAGRGPLAGPVVAACVILDPKDPILYVNDSKKLSAIKREELYVEIINRSISYGIGVVSEKDIDEINILQATYKAMRLAIGKLKIKPNHLLNDAVIIPEIYIPQEKIIKGDAKSLSIAAASILAKVSRDRIMVAYDELYPEYNFASNKGYGSSEHIKAIKQSGPSKIHRNTFIKNFL